MLTLLALIVVLGVIFWAIYTLISSLAAVFFVVIATILILKLTKEIFK